MRFEKYIQEEWIMDIKPVTNKRFPIFKNPSRKEKTEVISNGTGWVRIMIMKDSPHDLYLFDEDITHEEVWDEIKLEGYYEDDTWPLVGKWENGIFVYYCITTQPDEKEEKEINSMLKEHGWGQNKFDMSLAHR
jgi:hypothetical protein